MLLISNTKSIFVAWANLSEVVKVLVGYPIQIVASLVTVLRNWLPALRFKTETKTINVLQEISAKVNLQNNRL